MPPTVKHSLTSGILNLKTCLLKLMKQGFCVCSHNQIASVHHSTRTLKRTFVWVPEAGSKDGKRWRWTPDTLKKAGDSDSPATEATMMPSARTSAGPDLHPSIENGGFGERGSGHSIQHRRFFPLWLSISPTPPSQVNRYLFLFPVSCHYKRCFKTYLFKCPSMVYFYLQWDTVPRMRPTCPILGIF